MIFEVSIIGFIVGTIINMGLGALWYSPVLFAEPWMKESGVTMDKINDSQSQMGKIYGLTAFGAMLTSYVMGFLIANLGIDNIMVAIMFAMILWIGTNLPMIIKNWGFEGRTVKLGVINHGYDLVVYILVSIAYVIF